jgi:hypothetical protein
MATWTDYFVMAIYALTAAVFTVSACYIIFSKKHYVSLTTMTIYLLSITSMALSCSALTFSNRIDSAYLNITACSFCAHWLSIGLFTSEYIKVATQTPVFKGGNRLCQSIDFFYWITVFIILGYSYYTYVFVQGLATYLAWLSFLLKIFFTLAFFLI